MKEIGRYAFNNCDNFEEIVIAKDVEVIEDNAISGNVIMNFTGSEKDWKNIAGTEYIDAKVIYNYK